MNVVSLDMIEAFLLDVDMDFPIPLSDKVILNEYAVKLYEKATLCCEIDNGTIVGMVAGYTENIINDMAYIALVGVKKNIVEMVLPRNLLSNSLTYHTIKRLTEYMFIQIVAIKMLC